MKSQGIADSLAGHLKSRNFDIFGYWGVGYLLLQCRYQSRLKCRFKASKSFLMSQKHLVMNGCIVNGGKEKFLNMMRDIDVDVIDIKFTYSNIHRTNFPKYECVIDVFVLSGQSYGQAQVKTVCWTHDRYRERQSSREIRI